jgi:uncharacterized protein YuzE
MEVMAMRLVYDREADAAKIAFVDSIGFGGVAKSVVCDVKLTDAAITLDFDTEDRLIAIELLGASKLLPAKLLEESRKYSH